MPRLEIDVDKIQHNARTLVKRLALRGISVTAVTKATLGSPVIARALLAAGAVGLGDSRIENAERLRCAGIAAHITLIRSPMLSQVGRVVASIDVSLNTELEVIRALSRSAHASGCSHGVVLMVELGDLREGIMPCDLESVVDKTLQMPGITLRGIGGNLACRSGVVPDTSNMNRLSELVDSLEEQFGKRLPVISGGNSANLAWALSGRDTGRINDLRLGESILLGREPLHRRPLDDLHTDAITLIAEVIESKCKPTRPWGRIAETAFGKQPRAVDRGDVQQSIFAIGRQDTDPSGLYPPARMEIVGASSDHLVVHSDLADLQVGCETAFQVNYSAMMRLMASPFVTKSIVRSGN